MHLFLPSCGRLLAALGLATSLSFTTLPASAGNAPTTQLSQADLSQPQGKRQALIEAFSESAHPALHFVTEKLRQGKGQWAEVEGTVEVFYEDHEDMAQSRLRQILVTPAGERLELLASNNEIAAPTGASVIISGIEVGDTEQELSYLAYDANGDGIEVEATAAPAQTVGDQHTLVIMVNFYDKDTQPFTQTQVYDTIFNQAAAYFEESSFNKMTLSGDVYGWYTLSLSAAVCDNLALMTEAKAFAEADGADLSSYQRFVYVFPKNACGWSGLASVGGLPSAAMLNGTLDPHIVTHEIGHTLGLDHAMGLECGSDTLGDTCSWVGQGDYLDSMGGELGHFNSSRKEWLGWFESGDQLTVNTSGTYQLEPYSTLAGNLPKSLKIPRGIDPETGYPEWISVEYRQAIGFDDNILVSAVDSSNVLNGTIIHLVQDGYVLRSWILDMNPASAFPDFIDPALEVGLSFTDPATGITITTLSANGSIAEVAVDMPDDMPTCTTAAPAASLTAMSGASTAAGESLDYRLEVTNQDSTDCDTATFDLSASVPSGWSRSLSTTSLSLAPGASGSATLSVTSGDALDGSYVIEGSVTQRSSGKAGTANATYTVSTANSAPDAVDDSAGTQEDTAVTIPVLDNDSDPDGDPLSVIAVSGVNGTATINSNGTITYTPPSGFSGTETFSYSIEDGNGGSDTATVSVAVNSTYSAPDAVDDSASTAQKTAVDIPVLANDSDPDGDTLTVVSVTQPASRGAVSVNADGTLNYSPHPQFTGAESFSYTISDGSYQASAQVTVTVGGSTSGDGGGSSGGGNGGGKGKNR